MTNRAVIALLVGWGIVSLLINMAAPSLMAKLRRWWYRRLARKAATPPIPVIPTPTNEELQAEAARIEYGVQSRRMNDYVQRYAADLLADGVSPADAIREARDMWDEINRVG